MHNFLDNCQEKDFLLRLGQIAKNNNFEIYLAGGFVRDTLLGRISKDYDIGVVGDALEFTTILEKELNVKAVIFKRFGTSVINFEGNDYEFVGTRKETYESHSRNPIVTVGTMEDDINRRDFTINGIIYKLNPDVEVRLIDLHGGQQDIENRIIKCIGDPEVVYSEDPLRMLRAIRFSCQLGFEIEKDTYDFIKKMHHRIEIISTERIVVEFLKILKTERAVSGIDMLKDVGLLKYILPEIISNYNNSIEDLNWVGPRCKDEYLRLISLFVTIDPRRVPDIYKRLKFPTYRKNQAVKLLEMIEIFGSKYLHKPKCYIPNLLLINYHEWILDFLKLADSLFLIDSLLPLEYSENLNYIVKKYTSWKFRNINRVIPGDLIMEMFELEPGPAVKLIKDKIIEDIILGELSLDGRLEIDVIKYMNKNFEALKELTLLN